MFIQLLLGKNTCCGESKYSSTDVSTEEQSSTIGYVTQLANPMVGVAMIG